MESDHRAGRVDQADPAEEGAGPGVGDGLGQFRGGDAARAVGAVDLLRFEAADGADRWQGARTSYRRIGARQRVDLPCPERPLGRKQAARIVTVESASGRPGAGSAAFRRIP